MSHRIVANTGLASAFLLFSTCLGVLLWGAGGPSQHGPEIGKVAPEFAGRDTDGRQISTSDLRGKAVVLFFGSDVCSESKKYASCVEALATKYKTEPRLKVIAINSNTLAHAVSSSELKLIPGTVPTILDPVAEVAKSFGVMVTPTVCIIDPSGRLQYSGAFDNGTDEASGQYCELAIAKTLDGVPVDITSTQTFGRTVNFVK